jgi:hypothetical protein
MGAATHAVGMPSRSAASFAPVDGKSGQPLLGDYPAGQANSVAVDDCVVWQSLGVEAKALSVPLSFLREANGQLPGQESDA